MADRARRRSGIPEAVPSALARLPGRAGGLASGTAERLRGIRFVGLVAEIAFFVVAGLAPLAVAALALLGGIEPLLSDEAAARIDGVFIGVIVEVLGGDPARSALVDVRRLLGSGLSRLALPLGIGLVFSARGFTGAMRGLGHLYGQETTRPFWRDALATVLFTAGAALLATLAALGALLAPIGGTGPVLGVFAWARWLIVPAGLMLWLTTLYHYSRGPETSPWAAELSGAAVATIAVMGAGMLFGLYLQRTPGLGLGPFLGTLVGTVLATFSLVYAYAAAVVIGGAFNAEWAADPDR